MAYIHPTYRQIESVNNLRNFMLQPVNDLINSRKRPQEKSCAKSGRYASNVIMATLKADPNKQTN